MAVVEAIFISNPPLAVNPDRKEPEELARVSRLAVCEECPARMAVGRVAEVLEALSMPVSRAVPMPILPVR